MTELSTIGLVLDPLDVLFFRDGRAFNAAALVGGGLPLPQTLAGALTTALLRQQGCDFERLGAAVKAGREWPDAVVEACGDAGRWLADVRFRGPWLARRPVGGSLVEPLVPAPATLHEPKKRPLDQNDSRPLEPLRPLPPGMTLPGWKESRHDGLRPLWSFAREPMAPARGFLTAKGLAAFLAGKPVPACELLGAEQLYEFDHRTGIEIDADRLSAAESQIYGAKFLSLARGARSEGGEAYDVVLYAELVLPVAAPAAVLSGIETVPLGGEGRRVALCETAPYAWPEPPADEGHSKPFLLLTTPGIFAGRWKPACLIDHLVAAAVPGDVPVSGWDLARGGPKPTRFAAAAGSVYFLDQFPHHLADSLSDAPHDRQQGWGSFLKGVWTDDAQ